MAERLPGLIPAWAALLPESASRAVATEKITEPLIERALTEWLGLPKLTPKEERAVATHEAGTRGVRTFL